MQWPHLYKFGAYIYKLKVKGKGKVVLVLNYAPRLTDVVLLNLFKINRSALEVTN
jgi:hypothetical protein